MFHVWIVDNDECDHRFCNRHRAWAQTWVVTSMHFEIDRHTVLGHRPLRLADRRRRLHEQKRCGGYLVPELLRVIDVVASDADDF
jgi:hypothetical protein